MRTKQSGASLVELILAVAAGVMITSALIAGVSWLTALKKAKREGRQLELGAVALQSLLDNHGRTIIVSGTAPGFANPLAPTFAELRAGDYLPAYMSQNTAFNGTLQFVIRRGPRNDLFGLVCDTQNITERGAPSPRLASEVMMAAGGVGLRTSIANPGVLNGQAFDGIASPINGPAIACAWAYIGNPA